MNHFFVIYFYLVSGTFLIKKFETETERNNFYKEQKARLIMGAKYIELENHIINVANLEYMEKG